MTLFFNQSLFVHLGPDPYGIQNSDPDPDPGTQRMRIRIRNPGSHSCLQRKMVLNSILWIVAGSHCLIHLRMNYGVESTPNDIGS